MSVASLVLTLNRTDGSGPAAAIGADSQAGGEAGTADQAPAAPTDAVGADGAAAPTVDPRDVPGVPIGPGGVALTAVPSEPAVRIDTFFDFMCPYCGEFENNYAEQLQQMVDAGQIVLVQHPLGFLDRLSLGTNYSSRAASAAYSVAEGAPEAYGAFVAALFDAQPEENTEGLPDAEISAIAEAAGVPAGVATAFWQTDYMSEQNSAAVSAMDAGVTGTPTLMISTPDSAPEKWDYELPLDQLVAQKAGQ
jgi:protein-disulfide isomerase